MTDEEREQSRDFPPDIFQTMLGLAMHPEIVGCVQDAQEVLAFDLPEADCKSFLLFHDFITNPQPQFISEWRASPREEKWYHALVEGLNGATRKAYACVLYHFQRLSDLESEVMNKISKRNHMGVLGNATGVGIGNTLIWDFEYQAFIFAYRQCLDYLTRGLAHPIHRIAGIRWRVSHKQLILLMNWVSRPLHPPDQPEPHPPCATIRLSRSVFQPSRARKSLPHLMVGSFAQRYVKRHGQGLSFRHDAGVHGYDPGGNIGRKQSSRS
ncbi:MAG: hypothetical protein WKF37_15035 [Bryobacteraceae bacterium]